MSAQGNVPALQCPSCGSENIHVNDCVASFNFHTGGSWDLCAFQLADDSQAECNDCACGGPADNFTVKEPGRYDDNYGEQFAR